MLFRKCFIATVLAAALVGTVPGVASAAPSEVQSVTTVAARPDTPNSPNAEQFRIKHGFGVYVGLWGSEVKDLARVWIAIETAGAIATCQLVASRLRGPMADIVKVLCTSLGAGVGLYVALKAARFVQERNLLPDGDCFQAPRIVR